eukprot:gene8216-813_t
MCGKEINADGNIRNAVQYVCENGSLPTSSVLQRVKKSGSKFLSTIAAVVSRPKRTPRILLIDEDDVALNPEIMSSTYNPSSYWNLRIDAQDKLQQVRQSGPYKKLLEDMVRINPSLVGLIDPSVERLMQDLQSLKRHVYQFDSENQRIGYRKHDAAIYLYSWCVSSAETEALTEDYGVKHRTVMPSMFGMSKLKHFEAIDLMIVNEEHYILTIVQEISKRHNNQCPVIVFFASEKNLREVIDSSHFAGLLSRTKVLVETLSTLEKNKIIRDATLLRRITVATRSFGRGIDFQVRDTQVLDKGGVHVLQTFLPKTMAEERQIMGRTARQCDTDSHSSSLESLDSGIEKLAFLRQKRDEKFRQQFMDAREKSKQAKKSHEESLIFLDNLRSDDKSKFD